MSGYTVGILTVSDTASKDNALDKSGPLLKDLMSSYHVVQRAIVPDDMNAIQKVLLQWSDELALHVVLITGGTGFSPRDVTPEAVKPLLEKETSGITHVLLSSSIAITPFAALSRPVTGIRKATFFITLPGSPKACKENMEAVLNILPHALDLLLDRSGVKQVHTKMQQGEEVRGHHSCTHHHGQGDETGQSASLDTPVSRRARSSPYPLIQVNQAHEIISHHAPLLNVISVPVSQYLVGYVLAEDVISVEPVPGYRASIVDGYAVHVEDGPGIYSIESISLAQSSTVTLLSRGKIARVATGGRVPDGANAVIMVEDTTLIKDDGQQELQVEILVSATSKNIREIGSDCNVGEMVGRQGQRVGSELVGTLASVGIRHVKVYRKPRVGVLSSGNEVMDHLHADTLKPGQIRDTNRMTLLAALQASGFETVVDLGIVDDEVDAMVDRLEEAMSKVDVLITTGGVSMGEADLMKPVLEQKMGATVHFGRVLMKPGKPTTFAMMEGKKLIFALPGNPVSAIVAFHLFVLVALRKMAGWCRPDNVLVPVKLKHVIELDARPEFHRVIVTLDQAGVLVAESTGNQQSSRMLSMVEANGLLSLPMRTTLVSRLQKGTMVPCILIGSL